MGVSSSVRCTVLSLWWVGLLVLWWSCRAAMGQEKYVRYKDPKQPVGARVKDLLARMTLEEKIGQMVQIDRSVASPQVMRDYFIGADTVPILSHSLFLCLFYWFRLVAVLD